MTLLRRHASKPPAHLRNGQRLEWLRLLRDFNRNDRALREIDERREQMSEENYGRLTRWTLDRLAEIEGKLEAIERGNAS